MDVILFLVMIVIGVIVYFTPAIVAHRRDHPQLIAIFWLDFLAGWSFVGWIAALIWALTNQRETKPKQESLLYRRPIVDKTCPECAEQVKREAKVCRFCGYRFDTKSSENPARSSIKPAS